MRKLIIFSFIFFLSALYSCGPYQDITVSKIEKTSITKLDDKGIEAEIQVRINNPNKTGFTIFKSDADVTLNGIAAGKGNIKHKVRIKPNSDEIYTFEVVSKLSDLSAGSGIAGLVGIAFSKNITIGIKGNIKAGKFFYKKKIPIDVKQKVPLTKD